MFPLLISKSEFISYFEEYLYEDINCLAHCSLQMSDSLLILFCVKSASSASNDIQFAKHVYET